MFCFCCHRLEVLLYSSGSPHLCHHIKPIDLVFSEHFLAQPKVSGTYSSIGDQNPAHPAHGILGKGKAIGPDINRIAGYHQIRKKMHGKRDSSVIRSTCCIIMTKPQRYPSSQMSLQNTCNSCSGGSDTFWSLLVFRYTQL
jgi:hypothetical protein